MAVLYVVLVIVNHIICAWHRFALGPQEVILTQQLIVTFVFLKGAASGVKFVL